MKSKILKYLCVLFSITFIFGLSCSIYAEGESGEEAQFDVNAKSAVLMDFATGTVLYAKNPDEALPPASVTKIMTLLLIMEAVDSGNISLEDEFQVSENAASMGGSQVYLEPGEMMKGEDLLKCIIIASANDAALTMAEAVAGSESAFVSRMNERAAELGMNNTNFENVTGLDDNTVNHVTSARDIALMSRELMNHKKIFDFTTIWMDTVREGAFGLTNTNRLIRFYNGATGLKTGSTSKAKFCISATAQREGLHLIAVIMGSETRDTRNEAAKTLLDWGFANYSVYRNDAGTAGDIEVRGGVMNKVAVQYDQTELLLKKGKDKGVTPEYQIDEYVAAPVKTGDRVGTVRYILEGETLKEDPIYASSDVDKISFLGLLFRMIGGYLLK